MKTSRKIKLAVLLLFIAMQFIRPARNLGSEVPANNFSNVHRVPNRVQSMLERACYDCHSNHTNYPWYSNIQPLGWWLERHIRKGKAEINFSEFGSYSHRRQISKLKNIEGSIEDGSMPLSSYRAIHKDARLSDEDRSTLIGWLQKTRDSLSKQ
ncbi:MAG TPA: heme-binding domain-containing protein [Flavisolibacter sp.]|nr:heme-binding domain-containing protein [Flavisolibacter sp.]